MTTHTAPSLDELLDQRSWLAGLARRLVHDAHAAEDAAQETWLQALAHRVTLREPRAWLATVLGNVARQRHRGDRNRRRREHEVARATTAAASLVADANERFEVQRTVAAAVQALDEPFRSTVLLHHFEGHSLAEIARIQQVPAGTVRWRLHRAHELLRERLRRTLGESQWRASLSLLSLPRRGLAVLPLLAAALVLVGSAMWWAPWNHGELAPPAPAAALAPSGTTAAATGPGADDPPGAARTTPAPAANAAEPQAPRELRATVVATIVDAEGAPVADARLELTRLRAAAVRSGLDHLEVAASMLRRLAPTATSRADGRVRLDLRADEELLALLTHETQMDLIGEAEFTIAAEGHATERVAARGAPGETVSLGTITLQRAAEVTGRVQFADGSPAVGAKVSLQHPPLPHFPERLARDQFARLGDVCTTVGDDGTYRLSAVRTGLALAWASLPDHVSAFVGLDITTPRTAIAPLVLHAATAEKRPTYDKQVVVRTVDAEGKAMPMARIDYRWDGPRGQIAAGMLRTRDDGRATLSLWQPCYERPERLFVSALQEEPPLGPVRIEVPLQGDDEVVLRLLPAATCTVRALDTAGKAVPAFQAQWQAVAPAVGQASADGVRGVAALMAPTAPATLAVSGIGYLTQQVPLEPGQSELEVTLHDLHGISGRVTKGGKPVADARISVLHCDRPVLINCFRSEGERRGQYDAKSEADGRFRINQDEPATLRLLVRAAGHANLVTEPHGFDPRRGWNDLELALDDGGTLEGVVRDADGNTHPRAWVAINDFFGDARTVLSDAEGRYRCTGLRAGGYEVRAAERSITEDSTSTLTNPGLLATRPHVDCEVRAGETTKYDVLAARCRVSGRLSAAGFSPRGWRAQLRREHDDMQIGRPVPLAADGRFELTASTTGPHCLDLYAPGGPYGNVQVTVQLDLRGGELAVDVPVALAPAQGVAAGGSATAWTSLVQTRLGTTVRTAVDLDPTTLAFAVPLAPVGDVVLVQGTSTGSIELARFVVAPR